MAAVSHRKERVGDLLRSFLSVELLQLADPRLQLVTVTDVKMSADLKSARIFWSAVSRAANAPDRMTKALSSAEENSVASALEHASGLLKRRIADELDLRYIPRLIFEYDRSLATGAAMEELLSKISTPKMTVES